MLTAVLAVATAPGKLAVPVLIQQILDRGVLGDAGYRPGFVAVACGSHGARWSSRLYFVSRATFLRLVRAAEASLLGLRVRTFEHIHRLSLADHVDQRRGALVSRVTSDVETMAQFTEWGAVAWIVDSVLLVDHGRRDAAVLAGSSPSWRSRCSSRSSRRCATCSGGSWPPTTRCAPRSAARCPRCPSS